MHLKLIPPYLLLIAVCTMVLLHYLFPLIIFAIAPYHLLGLVLIFAGLLMARQVAKMFEKAQTEIHTFRRPRHLVTKGLFRYSRNPIYLGFATSLLGLSILLSSLVAFIVVLLFVWITDVWYIRYEEQVMIEDFRDDYIRYKSKVRRWL